MINKDFFRALEDLQETRNINKETFVELLETALTSAYKKNFGEAKSATVKLLPEKNKIQVYSYKTVVEEVEEEMEDKQISLEDAKLIKKSYKVGDTVTKEENPKNFGRIAAQTAKQVVMQKLREIERETTLAEIAEKEDEIVTAVVTRIDGKNLYVEIAGSKIEAFLQERDQIPGERYRVGDKLKVYVKKIRDSFTGTMIQVSRSNTGFVKRLFELEIPEILEGDVIVQSIAREAGYRTKIAVSSDNSNVDPVGACVGNKGMRINQIVAELNGEKIDIVLWSENSEEFIARALSPAEVISVTILEDSENARRSRAIVPADKLSLAIGKAGQNVRLAARLTGWKIDVKKEGYIEEEKPQQVKATTEITTDLDDMFGDDMDL